MITDDGDSRYYPRAGDDRPRTVTGREAPLADDIRYIYDLAQNHRTDHMTSFYYEGEMRGGA